MSLIQLTEYSGDIIYVNPAAISVIRKERPPKRGSVVFTGEGRVGLEVEESPEQIAGMVGPPDAR